MDRLTQPMSAPSDDCQRRLPFLVFLSHYPSRPGGCYGLGYSGFYLLEALGRSLLRIFLEVLSGVCLPCLGGRGKADGQQLVPTALDMRDQLRSLETRRSAGRLHVQWQRQARRCRLHWFKLRGETQKGRCLDGTVRHPRPTQPHGIPDGEKSPSD